MTDFLFALWAFDWASLAWWHWVLLEFFLTPFVLAFLAWVTYKAIIPASKRYGKWVLVLAVPALLYDVLFNLRHGTLLFWRLPFELSVKDDRIRRSWTFSDRLQIFADTHIRFRMTQWEKLVFWLISITNKLTEPNHIKGVSQ